MSEATASALKTRISDETKSAMKARDKERVATLRMVNAEIKRIEVDERRELSDADILTILTKMLKQRQDSLTQFRQAERNDLADKEAYEIGVIEDFMPAQMDEDQVRALVEECIAKVGASSMQDMGKVMGALKSAAAGQFDMGRASGLVKQLLS